MRNNETSCKQAVNWRFCICSHSSAEPLREGFQVRCTPQG